jgi:hypothetical protein
MKLLLQIIDIIILIIILNILVLQWFELESMINLSSKEKVCIYYRMDNLILVIGKIMRWKDMENYIGIKKKLDIKDIF